MLVHGGLWGLSVDSLLLGVYGHGSDLGDIDGSSTRVSVWAAADQSV